MACWIERGVMGCELTLVNGVRRASQSVKRRLQGWSEDVPEVGLLGRAAGHGLVMGVQVGIIVDFQRLRVKGGRDLCFSTSVFVSGRLAAEGQRLKLETRGDMGSETHLGPDKVLNGSAGAHGGEPSSDAREAERVSSKHGG